MSVYVCLSVTAQRGDVPSGVGKTAGVVLTSVISQRKRRDEDRVHDRPVVERPHDRKTQRQHS